MSFLIAVILALQFSPVFAADYHIDAEKGSDHNTGLLADQAWRSLEPVNTTTFKPGDRILIKAGTHYNGQLTLKGSGTKQQPVELARYGTGPDPRIDAQGKSLDTILLQNVEYWSVHHLEITNHGDTTAPERTGVRLKSNAGRMLHGIHLSHLFVHDVNGDLHKEQEGCGIFFESRGATAGYDDLIIENCHLLRTDRNGICQRTQGKARSTHVIIRNNLLENIGGDGIKLWGTNGGVIEHNTLHGGRMRCDDYAAGIWPFACDDTLIQYNEVSGMKGVKDGQGFDSDYICRNSIYQYNYSHDNDGGFILICSPGSSYCQGTIIRYNISQNDGQSDSSVFHFGGNSSNTLVYNNTIYLSRRQHVPLLRFDEWSGGNAHHTVFMNNIFYADGQASYLWGKSVDNTFDCNCFFGNHLSAPTDAHQVTGKPPLVDVGSGKDGFASLGGYKWLDGPAPVGVLVPHNGGLDFFGNPVPSGQAPHIGASQR